MAKKKVVGAFDIGASGGKFIAGIFDGGGFESKEIYRFENKPVNLYLKAGHGQSPVSKIYWNDLSIYQEILAGLRKFSESGIGSLDSLGIDTWGTDGACYTKEGEITGRVYNYRDHRLDRVRDELFEVVSERELFQLTGVPSYPFNMVNQLFWLMRKRPDVMKIVDFFLPITGIFYYYLCGARICEYTWASTTQLLDPHTKKWSRAIFERLGIPISIMPALVEPGTKIGFLNEEFARDTGITSCEVIATAAHDTACAYVAAPVEEEENSLIISSGTWSLVGKLIPEPVINDIVFENHFTNEGGVGNIRLLKNVMGTWIVQELRRKWSEKDKKDLSWDEIVEMAKKGEKFFAFIDPDDSSFYNPDDMEAAVRKFCRDSGQRVPEGRETILRMVYESLALKYGTTNEMMRNITGEKNKIVYIVGGGAKNALLNEFTASATGLPVVAGPVEATAIGNILIQAKTLGIIESLREGTSLVNASLPVAHYEPEDTGLWKRAMEDFRKFLR